MKSKILAKTLLPDRFRDDLDPYEELSRDQLSAILGFYELRQDLTHISSEQENIDLSNKTNLSADTISSVLSTLRYLTYLFSQEDERPEDFVDDLADQYGISENVRENLLFALGEMSSKGLFRVRTDEKFSHGLPMLEYAHTRCIVLSSFDKEYSLEDDPANYEPKIFDVQPATILYLEYSGPQNETEVSIVLTEGNLHKLLKRLQLAQKQMDALKNYSSGGEY